MIYVYRKGIMKKNILSSMVLLFGIAILSTGCIKADSTITFDNKDNMKVETTVLFPKELMSYAGSETSSDDFTKDLISKINGTNVSTEVVKVDGKDGVGEKRIETYKNISKAEKVEKIAFIIPKNTESSILTVNNYIFFKKYLFEGKLEESEKAKSTSIGMNPNDLISSKIRIQVPTQAKKVKANTNTKDIDNSNIYVWTIDYNKDNPIILEFCMINWYAVSGVIILLLLLIFSILCSKKVKIDLSRIFSKTKQQVEILTEKSTQEPLKIKRQKINNPKKIIVIIVGILSTLAIITFFSLPTICNLLVDNSIKNIYVGEISTATKMIEVANVLNLDKNKDISTEIFAKGIAEIENNDNKTAKAFFDLVAKTKTDKNKEYATELTNKAIKALNQNQIMKCKYLTEAAIKFDTEIPKAKIVDFNKKQQNLASNKKYQELLIISEILIMLDPNNPENHLRHGASLALLNKNKEAIDAYTKAISLKKDLGTAYLNRGLVYAEKLSNDEKAFSDLSQAINLCYAKQDLALAKLNIAKIYMKRKNYERVVSNACSAEEIFFELGDMTRREQSMNLCYTAICNSGGYCGPLYY